MWGPSLIKLSSMVEEDGISSMIDHILEHLNKKVFVNVINNTSGRESLLGPTFQGIWLQPFLIIQSEHLCISPLIQLPDAAKFYKGWVLWHKVKTLARKYNWKYLHSRQFDFQSRSLICFGEAVAYVQKINYWNFGSCKSHVPKACSQSPLPGLENNLWLLRLYKLSFERVLTIDDGYC